MSPPAFAHSPAPHGAWHELTAHLRGTATRAREFADSFDAGDIAEVIGAWHDVGKFHPSWQAYLRAAVANPALRGTGPEHKLAGARLAAKHPNLAPFALAIAGHHGGIPSVADLKSRLADTAAAEAIEESLRLARAAIPGLEGVNSIEVPRTVSQSPRATEQLIRMVYSALVDADFLDTESHFDGHRSDSRESSPTTPSALLDALLADQRRRFSGSSGVVADVRRAVFEACMQAAEQPPGVFRLTVPTGGGKTRAALAFALRHAALHGLRRAVIAVPFVSITEQTAGVYRSVFSDAGGRVVLEHHSGFDDRDTNGDGWFGPTWARLAAENWDAPIVVTTTIQLLESLFTNRPSKARKIHNLARSVIVLDEVQSLPTTLLDPTLEMLSDLCTNYGATVVLSTATQPAFEVLPSFRDVQATDIVPDPQRHYRALRRVRYESRMEARRDWTEVAAWLREEPQALCIVNRKADAIALVDALADPRALHLSTLLCGAHRRDVIGEVRRRLEAGEDCRLVSTQVVEAGVDLDFPAVYRALAPLDAIIQAAGRCNREGRLADLGRVVIFEPREGDGPGGAYRAGTDQARRYVEGDASALDSLDTLRAYYRGLLPLLATDAPRVQAARDVLDYPEVAARYRLIDDDTESVAITDYGTPDERKRVREQLEELRTASGNPRGILRSLQPYIVSLRRRHAEVLRARGLIRPVLGNLGEWHGHYDPVVGLVASGDLDRLVI